jgi:hypothetical protein
MTKEVREMKKIISIAAIFVLFIFAGCTEYHAKGAGIGAAVGGIAGALLDNGNPWRGAVIGGALGAMAGATVTDISMKASQEAAATGKPVEYRTTDGRGVYRADPIGYNARTNCHKIQERVWEDGKLIKNEIKEICRGNKTEQRY